MIYRGKGIALLAVGSMVKTAEAVRKKLLEDGDNPTLVNARFVKPLDKKCWTAWQKTMKLSLLWKKM